MRIPKPGARAEAEVIFARGVEAQHEKRLGEAMSQYEAALQADPAYFEAYYNLGLAAYEAGDLGRSLSAYEQALSINPTSANARFNFALALQKAHYPRDAANELEKLLAKNPQETHAHLTLANLYAQQLGVVKKAREHYLKVLQAEPQHPEAAAIRNWLSANP